MFERSRVLDGMTVRSSDGDKLGKVVSIDDSGMVVEKGIFFPKDYRCSFDQIDDIYGDEIYLKWGTHLVEQNYDSYYGSGSYAKETSDENMWSDYNYSKRDNYSGSENVNREHMSIPLREEELHVQKTGMKESGRVRIIKTVHTEDKTFTVPLRREEVRIERVPAGDIKAGEDFGAVGDRFEDKTVTIPIREEQVEITKRPVVKEAIKVTTESQTYEKPVHGEVRKEDARIERDDDLNRSDLDRDNLDISKKKRAV